MQKQIHRAEWSKKIKISSKFILKKLHCNLLDYEPSEKFDLIYFDAFAPDKQANMWTKEIFSKLYNATNLNGVLVTYSAKGTVKQALRDAGYKVKRLSGSEGKRHMVKATKE